MPTITLDRAQFFTAAQKALNFYRDNLEKAELAKSDAIKDYIVEHSEWQAKKWFFKEKPLTYEQADSRLYCSWRASYHNACYAIRDLKNEIDALEQLMFAFSSTKMLYGVDTIELVDSEVYLIFACKKRV